MGDLRYIAERWLSEYGAETPKVVRGWARELEAAPTAAAYLVAIADIAVTILAEQNAGRGEATVSIVQPVR